MILKKLIVENFGTIGHAELSFDPKWTVISDPRADDMIRAIGVVTDNRSLVGTLTEKLLTERTRIVAEVGMQDGSFRITARGRAFGDGCEYDIVKSDTPGSVFPERFFEHIRLCREEEELTYYRFDPKNDYPIRLLTYKNPDQYYSPGNFRKKTNGIGLTSCFRAFLTEYIRKKPSNDFTFANILQNGLSVKDRSSVETDRIFDYLSFLNINAFWDEFEKVRNMNHESRPLFADFTLCGTSMELAKEMTELYAPERQVIVMAM